VIGILVAAVLLCAASLLAGRALFVLCGRTSWTWLEGAVGLAVLVVFCHIAISLPGGAIVAVLLTAALLIGAAVVAATRRGPVPGWQVGLVVAALVIALSVVPFALNARTGVLGEGIYSNDHAVHLYWADWLQNEIGVKPKGIGWGYPVGPHAVVATFAEATGISVEEVFNGLLIAIPALTSLAALTLLDRLPPVRRAVAAVLVGMPYLAVSFFAQSSFKETALALFVVAFAISLALLSREGPEGEGAHPDRALVAGIVLLVAASVLTFSVPGLAWFGLGLAIWLVVELVAGRLPFSFRSLGAGLRRAWPLLAVGAVVLIVLAIVEAGTISRFADRIRDVQESEGRLAGRLPPWEVLGVWPRGDFRVATAAVDGAPLAILFGFVCAGVATVWWLRRRQLAIPALVLTALAIFLVARATSGIHVEAKALIVASPLVMLFVVRGLLDGDARGGGAWRIALGALFAGLAVLSTLLALRATPVGTPAHVDELAELRDRVAGKEVAYLSLDRFAPYRLRGAERVQSPGGYIPNPLKPREGKEWGQSEAVDFDSLSSDVLDRFGYAVTTGAAYGSSPPENWDRVASTDNFVLWKRNGKASARDILDEDPAPGAVLACGNPPATETGIAGVWPTDPILADGDPWKPTEALEAGESAHHRLLLPEGTWQVSMQYSSEVPLRFRGGGLDAELPASLDGFYANAPGKGPFWPIGEVEVDGGTVEFEVTADEAPALSRLVGAERRAWLGDLAAVRIEGDVEDPPGPVAAQPVSLRQACGGYVDWYIAER
jgi:hypothetical protein